MSVGLLFPGQGSHRPGMLHRLPDGAVVSRTLAEAHAVLAQDPLGLDTERALRSTVAVQLALLIAGTAANRTLLDKGGEPDVVAGFSVGAFAAAVAAGVLEFADALRLVRLRGDLMEKACPSGYGMAALVGLGERAVREIVERINSPGTPVFLSNLNAPSQFVVAGAEEGLADAIDAAKAKGASKAVRLNVSVPSHCVLLASAADHLRAALAQVPLKAPRVPYVANRTGRALRDEKAIGEDLATNLAHPVRWHDATVLMYELGVRLFVEIPPGAVLTTLAAAAFPGARTVACADTRLDSVLALIRRERSGW